MLHKSNPFTLFPFEVAWYGVEPLIIARLFLHFPKTSKKKKINGKKKIKKKYILALFYILYYNQIHTSSMSLILFL